MPLILSTIFWIFGVVAIGTGAVTAIYLVLGLLLVQDLRQCDSKQKALQRQTLFLADDTVASSDLILKNTASLDSSSPIHSQGLHLAVERTRQEPQAIGSR
jgi:hypothetical protein